jgi:hypothetical protein
MQTGKAIQVQVIRNLAMTTDTGSRDNIFQLHFALSNHLLDCLSKRDQDGAIGTAGTPGDSSVSRKFERHVNLKFS